MTVSLKMLGRKLIPLTLDDDILMVLKEHKRVIYLWSALKNMFGTYSSLND